MFSRLRTTSVLLALGLLPCPAQAQLKVVATTADLAALAREIGGARVELTTLARPTEDPHFVDPKPSLIVKLNRADALLEGGAELESGWLGPLLESARNPKLAPGAPGRIVCRQGIALLEVPVALDRSKGDIHALGNPHYLIDPANARMVAQHLGERLTQLDPAGAETYHASLKKFIDQLDTKLAEWQKLLAPFQGQRVVAYHNSWPYFARRFGLKIDLFLEPKPGIPPSPAHLAEVITKMKNDRVQVIIVDAYVNRRTAETVAARTDARIVEVTQFPGGLKNTEGGYLQLLDYLVRSLAKALAGEASRP
jgi:zinc/manganese transport system substrate-binding protein